MALEDVEFYPMQSSNVAEAGYDGDEMVLYVRFLKGALYYYEGVPPDVWDQFISTDSAGKFIHTHLKGRYPYGRIE